MTKPALSVRMARSDADVAAAQRLRYNIFVTECGADVAARDHFDRRESDKYDAIASHLLLEDTTLPPDQRVVGTYRFMNQDQAARAGGFYSAGEFDLSALLRPGGTVLELGRSCVHPAYRKGPGLMMLWQGVATQVLEQDIDLLFGVASFPGTNPTIHAEALSYLHHFHPAGRELPITTTTQPAFTPMKPADIDRKAALVAMPPLIKAYLRLGAVVGEGVFVDHNFNTTDVCLVVDTHQISAAQKARYTQALPA